MSDETSGHQGPVIAERSAPSKRLFSVLAVLTIAACGGEPAVPPTSPSPLPALLPPLPPPRTVTGSVWLSSPTAPQPLAGINVGIWLERPRSGGPAGAVKSDSAGRFSFEAPSDALVRLYTRPQVTPASCGTRTTGARRSDRRRQMALARSTGPPEEPQTVEPLAPDTSRESLQVRERRKRPVAGRQGDRPARVGSRCC
jgi:hypothetical protein